MVMNAKGKKRRRVFQIPIAHGQVEFFVVCAAR